MTMRKLMKFVAASAAACALIFQPAGIASAQTRELLEYPGIEKPVVAERAMVVSQSGIASEVGRAILARGGNAVDAAVATAFALAVTLPRAGNIGGDGFMIVHLAAEGRSIAIDYRSVAPAAATLEAYLEADGSVSGDVRAGARSAGVPGTVAGLALAHRKYGRLPWRDLVAPAIRLAEEGVILTRDEAWVLEWGRKRLSRSPAGRAAFFKPDGSGYRAGERLVQPDLAWSLRQIAEGGEDAFYRGPIARRLASGVQALGGYITESDLAAYRAIERPVLEGSYRGHTIVTMPPASGGGASLLELLNILETFEFAQDEAGSARSIHLMAEAMKLSFTDRWRHAGDTDHVAVPLRGLTSKDYARLRAGQIRTDAVIPRARIDAGDPWAFESTETTHFSVVDEEGNAVSNTFTIGSDFGSGIMAPGTGFLLGNLIGNFSVEKQAQMKEEGLFLTSNLLVPGRRPVSSMSPTMVFRDGKPWLITGSPGGSTIIGTVAQIIVNSIDYDMNIAAATHAPRIFYNVNNGRLQMEPGFSPDTRRLLEARGHVLQIGETIGSSQSIRIEEEVIEGSADPRRPGAAAAPL